MEPNDEMKLSHELQSLLIIQQRAALFWVLKDHGHNVGSPETIVFKSHFWKSHLLPLVLCTANGTDQCYPGDDPPREGAPYYPVGLGNDHCQHCHQLQRKLCHPTDDICITVLLLNLEFVPWKHSYKKDSSSSAEFSPQKPARIAAPNQTSISTDPVTYTCLRMEASSCTAPTRMQTSGDVLSADPIWFSMWLYILRILFSIVNTSRVWVYVWKTVNLCSSKAA